MPHGKSTLMKLGDPCPTCGGKMIKVGELYGKPLVVCPNCSWGQKIIGDQKTLKGWNKLMEKIKRLKGGKKE